MKIYTLHHRQLLPISKEEAWAFLSNPAQLEAITPSDMSFENLTPLPESMYEGMLMHYRVAPAFGIPIQWLGQITHIEEGNFFIDEQRLGPFKFWHHEHRLIEQENETMLEDTIHYAIGYSFIGRIAHRFVIRKLLEEMFRYRKEKIEDYLSRPLSIK